MKTYTFRVDLPDLKGVWRTIELGEQQTLLDLHQAIQRAYRFDDDHAFSFFMSGEAWDRSSEYRLPEDVFSDEDDEDDEDGWEDEDWEDEEPELQVDEADAQAFRDALGDSPPPETFEDMLRLISTNAEMRSHLAKMVAKETGIPVFMADMMFKNADSLMAMMPEGALEDMFDEGEPAGDVRTTTLESLGLKERQTFMYLFDYGDEWRFRVKLEQVGEEEAGVTYPRVVQAVGQAPEQYPEWEEEWEEEGEEEEEE
jgi:hypothetical protein